MLESPKKRGVRFEKALKFGICGESREIGLLLEVAWGWDGRWGLGYHGHGSGGLDGFNGRMGEFMGLETC